MTSFPLTALSSCSPLRKSLGSVVVVLLPCPYTRGVALLPSTPTAAMWRACRRRTRASGLPSPAPPRAQMPLRRQPCDPRSRRTGASTPRGCLGGAAIPHRHRVTAAPRPRARRLDCIRVSVFQRWRHGAGGRRAPAGRRVGGSHFFCRSSRPPRHCSCSHTSSSGSPTWDFLGSRRRLWLHGRPANQAMVPTLQQAAWAAVTRMLSLRNPPTSGCLMAMRRRRTSARPCSTIRGGSTHRSR